MKGAIELNMRLLVAIIALLIGVAIIVIIVLKVLAPQSFANAGYEICMLIVSKLKFLMFSAESTGICDTFRS
ncbi:MAG: hypothetical protein NTW30_01590 [Candidatus Aenigmarchaeota archaeon]|nr:hypothetical protein [Candidatus Aenigmarchaeota archaeon]